MFEQSAPISRVRVTLSATLGFAMAFVGPAFGQEDEPGADAVISQQANAEPEEVIVTGERTRGSLIRQAGQETENFYLLLNQVLDNEDFEIRCRNEYPPGSNISRRVCRTRYQEELESRAALSAMQGAGETDEGIAVFSGSSFDQAPRLIAMQQQFEDEMLEAINTNPDLNRSAARLIELKAAIDNYETPREQRRREQDEAAAD